MAGEWQRDLERRIKRKLEPSEVSAAVEEKLAQQETPDRRRQKRNTRKAMEKARRDREHDQGLGPQVSSLR